MSTIVDVLKAEAVAAIQADLEAAVAADAAAAAADAASALNSKVLAEAAAVSADADATAAAAFAAAAATGARYYDTIALGRAAVADGATFGVVAGGSDGLTVPTLYRRDSSSTQTEIIGMANAASVLASEIEGLQAGLAAMFVTGTGTALVATTSGSVSDYVPVQGSANVFVLPAALGATPTISVNGTGPYPLRDAAGTEFAGGEYLSGEIVFARTFTSPDTHLRIISAGFPGGTQRALQTVPARGMRSRGILANGASVSGQIVPGVYRLSSSAGYTGLPTGYPEGASGMMFVYDPGDAQGTGEPTHIIQELMSQVPVDTGAAQDYHPRWIRRAALTDATIITGYEAWTPCTPVDAYLGNMVRSRGTIATATDLNLIWECGIYQGAGGSTYPGRPTEFPTGSFELMVTEYGGTDGFGQGRFVRQLLTSLVVTNSNTPQAFRAQYERVIDTTAPASTSGQYAWIARHASGGVYSGRTAVVLGDSIVQGTTGFDFCPILAQITGMTVVNGGFGGCRMGEHPTDADRDALGFYHLAGYIASGDWTAAIAAADALFADDGNTLRQDHAGALDALDWSVVDYIIVMFGTNDFTGLVPLGTASDATGATFRGAINVGIETILTAYPEAKLIFATPLWRARVVTNGDDSNLTPNGNGDYLVEYAEAIIERARAHQIPVIDLHSTGGVNIYNWETYLEDGLHPTDNTAGITLLAERVAAGLRAVV